MTGIPQGGLDTDVGGYSGKYQIPDIKSLEHHIQFGPGKGTEPPLYYHHLIFPGLDFIDNFGSPGAFQD